MAFRPGKWILWSPLIALPTFGAWYFEAPFVEYQLADKVRQQLNVYYKDTSDIVVQVRGRDVRLEGAVPDKSVLLSAKQTAAGVYGVRRVTDKNVAIGPLAAPLVAPAIAPFTPGVAEVAISGTWGHGPDETLMVILGDKKYTAGINPELTLDGAQGWVLKPGPLNAGTYNLAARVSRGTEFAEAIAPGGITIAAPAPVASAPALVPATIGPFHLENGVPVISGTWDSDNATSLSVQSAGKNWELSTDGPLRAPSPGQWVLASPDLADGSHDLTVIQTPKSPGATALPVAGQIVVDTVAPIIPQITDSAGFPVTGTFDAADTQKLTISVGDKAYSPEAGGPLVVKGNDWSLNLGLPPGTYNIEARAADKLGNISAASAPFKITIPEPEAPLPLKAPTVDAVKAAGQGEKTLTGTWPAGQGTGLAVDVNGQHFELGRDKALVTNGPNWSLILPTPLPPGNWDVVVTATDSQGRVARDETGAEITISAPAPAPVAAPDCTAEIAGVLGKSPIGFSTDSASLSASDLQTVQAIGGFMQHCPGMALEIGGHTDSMAPALYNEALSQRRADAVLKALTALGLDGQYLSAKGYGESRPVATNDTPDGRKLNRRIEVKTLTSAGQ